MIEHKSTVKNTSNLGHIEVKAGEQRNGQVNLTELANVYSNIVEMAKDLDNTAVIVNYTITCVRGAENKYYLSGTIHAAINLQCTTCMSALLHPLKVNSYLYVIDSVATTGTNNLSPETELVFMQHGKVDILELLESELMLALPEFIKHDITDAGCISYKNKFLAKDDKQNNNAKIGRTNPFSQLVDCMGS